MHHDANTCQSSCTLYACHIAGVDAGLRRRDGTRRPLQPSVRQRPPRERRRASNGWPTRAHRRRKRSAWAAQPSTGASCLW